MIAIGYGQDGRIFPITDFHMDFKNLNDMLNHIDNQQYDRLFHKPSSHGLGKDSLQLVCPIDPNGGIICLSNNFPNSNGSLPDELVIFHKQCQKLYTDGDRIPLHRNITSKVDYEVELCCILRSDVYDVDYKDAEASILGYSVMNDITARDLQNKYGQWFFGKSLDGFAVMGNFVVTPDEFDPLHDHSLCSIVNGNIRQCNSTKNLIHSPAEIISTLSRGMTLKKGTIISFGTPPGCELDSNSPRWLQKDDVVKCCINGLGSVVVYMGQ